MPVRRGVRACRDHQTEEMRRWASIDSKLDALRAKYGEGHGGELFDPKFRRVADKIFSKSGTGLAPYAGMPTFLTAPYREISMPKIRISATCRSR